MSPLANVGGFSRISVLQGRGAAPIARGNGRDGPYVARPTPLNMQMFYCDPPDLEDIICFGECLGGERLLAL